MDTKQCRVCKEVKSVEQFAKNISCKDGFRNECKKCHNSYFRQYFSDKDRMQKQVNRVDNNKKEYRWKIEQHKIELGCSQCGYNKCATALHFHHNDPKEKSFDIAKATSRSFNLEKLESELDKCILLCANCHSELEEKIRRKQT